MTARPAASARRLRRSTLRNRVRCHGRPSGTLRGANAGTPQGSGAGAEGNPGPQAAEGPTALVERGGFQAAEELQESEEPERPEGLEGLGGVEGVEGVEGTWPWEEGVESSVMVVTACRVRGSDAGGVRPAPLTIPVHAAARSGLWTT
ncbi:hypothetical protein QMZ92_19875 [Streptomyces sp. HNM0645]|uniref:hypothetical protein n=1 Tax=Streptomyces sp. HNM0645 TaxID=2782343 RepID=UPI0024B6A4FC|nr:hypothetical protein [Streptomyces sp. HNM0645]MDI9886574.1 hypothetical protein [Streptomyces sp. HNM0645]